MRNSSTGPSPIGSRSPLVRSARVLAAEVQRWNSALPQYLPGHAARIAGLDAQIAELDGLDLAGSAFAGVGIPACIARAEAVAQRQRTPAGRRAVTDGSAPLNFTD
jgi:hypothetical protein